MWGLKVVVEETTVLGGVYEMSLFACAEYVCNI